jgi:hypothetical protein
VFQRTGTEGMGLGGGTHRVHEDPQVPGPPMTSDRGHHGTHLFRSRGGHWGTELVETNGMV